MSVDLREAELFGYHEKTDLDEVMKKPVTDSEAVAVVNPPKPFDVLASTTYGYFEHAKGQNPDTDHISSVVTDPARPVEQQVSEPIQEPVVHKSSAPEIFNTETPSDTTSNPENQENAILPERTVNVHARRRMGVIGAAVALGLAVFSGNVSGSMPDILSGANPMAATPLAPDQEATQIATTALQNALNTAQGFYQANGTYRGAVLPSGVSAVTGKNMVVIASVINGACWYSAIVPGYDPTPRWDATASRCNPERLKQLQAEIDATE
jgi:hypothetical protein